jgi:hypothetical protein
MPERKMRLPNPGALPKNPKATEEEEEQRQLAEQTWKPAKIPISVF